MQATQMQATGARFETALVRVYDDVLFGVCCSFSLLNASSAEVIVHR